MLVNKIFETLSTLISGSTPQEKIEKQERKQFLTTKKDEIFNQLAVYLKKIPNEVEDIKKEFEALLPQFGGNKVSYEARSKEIVSKILEITTWCGKNMERLERSDLREIEITLETLCRKIKQLQSVNEALQEDILIFNFKKNK
jgi:hypothetical protein